MEITLEKRYSIAASTAQAWAVLSDIRATAACMPGAQITEALDATHFKGTVKSKVGPATLVFNGDIELLERDVATRVLKLHGKGADKSGSSAAMMLQARIDAEQEGGSVLVGHATITVNGKLAQFGSRLLVPVSEALLAQFAENFRSAAQTAVHSTATAESAASHTTEHDAAAENPPRPAPDAPPHLNVLALAWTVLKSWFAGLIGKRA